MHPSVSYTGSEHDIWELWCRCMIHSALRLQRLTPNQTMCSVLDDNVSPGIGYCSRFVSSRRLPSPFDFHSGFLILAHPNFLNYLKPDLLPQSTQSALRSCLPAPSSTSPPVKCHGFFIGYCNLLHLQSRREWKSGSCLYGWGAWVLYCPDSCQRGPARATARHVSADSWKNCRNNASKNARCLVEGFSVEWSRE